MNGSTEAKKKNHLKYLLYLQPIVLIILGYVSVILISGEFEPFTVVTGTSMEPSIVPGSIAIIDDVPFGQLKVGDVIVFVPQVAETFHCDTAPPPSSPSAETLTPCYVIHRIVSIQTLGNGSRILTTKGDNNPSSYAGIDTGITKSMYVGMVVLQFPILGYVTFPPYNEYLASLIVALLIAEIAFGAIRRAFSRRKATQIEYAKEEH
ncbi:MAG: signal peptidase I [Nitrososphaerales archaeon]|jgi:signal peptidase I